MVQVIEKPIEFGDDVKEIIHVLGNALYYSREIYEEAEETIEVLENFIKKVSRAKEINKSITHILAWELRWKIRDIESMISGLQKIIDMIKELNKKGLLKKDILDKHILSYGYEIGDMVVKTTIDYVIKHARRELDEIKSSNEYKLIKELFSEATSPEEVKHRLKKYLKQELTEEEINELFYVEISNDINYVLEGLKHITKDIRDVALELSRRVYDLAELYYKDPPENPQSGLGDFIIVLLVVIILFMFINKILHR